MYRNAYMGDLLTVFFACGSKPLRIWDTYCENGYVSKFIDPEIKTSVVEIGGVNVSTTYIVCPKGKSVLGITLPFLVMIVKNLKKYFSFEVTILDHTMVRRRFRVSNFQSTTQVNPLCTFMPIGLSDGWNQIQFNLAEFTRRAYKTDYMETQKLKINCNIRLRRVYFAEKLLTDEELPAEYKLFFPLASKLGKSRRATGSKEKQITPEDRKSSKHGVAIAESVQRYKMSISQEKIINLTRQRGDTDQIKSKQTIDGLGTGETTNTAIVENKDELVQLHVAEEIENIPQETVNEVTEEELQRDTTEGETVPETGEEPIEYQTTAEDHSAEGHVEGEIRLSVTEENQPTEDIAGVPKSQSEERKSVLIGKESSAEATATQTALEGTMTPIPEENTITETQDEILPPE